jgi:hypothetical protein
MNKMSNTLLRSWLVAIFGCGGIVNFAGDSGGGGGGTAPSSGGAPVNGPLAACEEFCALAPQCGDGGCVNQCLADFSTKCPEQYAALLRCLAENVDASCAVEEGECAAELDALSACEAPTPCVNQGCTGSPGTCGCEGTCEGVPASVECVQEVDPDKGVLAQCTCLLGDQVVGECTPGTLLCQIDVSCCAQFF